MLKFIHILQKLIFLSVLNILFLVSLFSQSIISDSLSGLNFVRRELNRIENSSTSLKLFFDKLILLENKKIDEVVIYHIGDSHVRSGFFSKELANLLFNSFGKKSGVFYLSTVIKTLPAKIRYRKVKNKQGKIVTLKSRRLRHKKTIVNEFREFTEPGERGLKYFIYGENGKTFNYFSKSETFRNHLQLIKPDLVIISLGTNDAFGKEFHPNYVASDIDKLITQLKKTNPKASIIFTIPPNSFKKKKYNNPNIANIREIIIDICRINNLAYWDLFSIMGGDCSMEKWYESNLAGNDKVHFTQIGYRFQAELLHKGILDGYRQFLSTGH